MVSRYADKWLEITVADTVLWTFFWKMWEFANNLNVKKGKTVKSCRSNCVVDLKCISV